ncbi:hypothetical protein [Hasllibacter sp. MH4015]|uniref:hypothetical protein n=1 Tax=Hasllibacter sp. MH4015 TaxID=2854029 RepID=UPI001CD7AB8D|nr:hypothetical protein [Hasllibacter sp. MH4015]
MQTTTEPATDAAHPGAIRAVISHPTGGTLVMSGFPGLETSVDGQTYFDPETCKETLAGMRALGARDLHVLVEPGEIDTLGMDLLRASAADTGLALIPFPIADYSVPSDTQFARWDAGRAARAEVLASGGTLAFHCQYGAGRSGLMASLCLIEGGMAPDAAMRLVRSHFPDAVESAAQEDWLRARHP